MGREQVVVTGIGMVTPLGATAPETLDAWREGTIASRKKLEELEGTSLSGAEVAVLPDINPKERLGGQRMLKYMSDAALLGCLAAREAATEAKIKERFPPERIGLFASTGLAAVSLDEVVTIMESSIDETGNFSSLLFGAQGLSTINPLMSFKILANMPPCLVSILEGIKGPNYLFTPWEGQTGMALLEAWQAVALGEVDCALVGTAENTTYPATVVHLRQAGFLADSEIPSAGATYLVFERIKTAQKDSVKVHIGINQIKVEFCPGRIYDPLASRMGRCFAAAPGILFALACLVPFEKIVICGVDHQQLYARFQGVA